jgi:hypothetical protein
MTVTIIILSLVICGLLVVHLIARKKIAYCEEHIEKITDENYFRGESLNCYREAMSTLNKDRDVWKGEVIVIRTLYTESIRREEELSKLLDLYIEEHLKEK